MGICCAGSFPSPLGRYSGAITTPLAFLLSSAIPEYLRLADGDGRGFVFPLRHHPLHTAFNLGYLLLVLLTPVGHELETSSEVGDGQDEQDHHQHH